jgi:cytochrome bd ubiquinol oxidase subunit II
MLETVWFLIWGLLWALYFMLDGFDLGVGMIAPFISKTEQEKQALLGTIGPFWNGNEVWLVTAGGVTFAAFPGTYAALFSAFYSPLMIILFALIVRGICIELRHHIASSGRRKLLDAGIFLGSFLPALLFGVAFANIFQGIPIDGESVFHGTTLGLLNPYGVIGGLLFLLLFLNHGVLWAAYRTNDPLADKLMARARGLWFPLVAVSLVFLVLTGVYTDLWNNYLSIPALLIFPAAAVAALLFLGYKLFKDRKAGALASSFILIPSSILFCIIGMFPNLLPSSLDKAFSLTVGNSAASQLSLTVMLVVAVITVPCVILYQLWAYGLFLSRPEEAKNHLL